MAMHDCLFRSALTSAWALFIDWDDIFSVYKPPSLLQLLEEHASKPWLSYGCQVGNVQLALEAHHDQQRFTSAWLGNMAPWQ